MKHCFLAILTLLLAAQANAAQYDGRQGREHITSATIDSKSNEMVIKIDGADCSLYSGEFVAMLNDSAQRWELQLHRVAKPCDNKQTDISESKVIRVALPRIGSAQTARFIFGPQDLLLKPSDNATPEVVILSSRVPSNPRRANTAVTAPAVAAD